MTGEKIERVLEELIGTRIDGRGKTGTKLTSRPNTSSAAWKVDEANVEAGMPDTGYLLMVDVALDLGREVLCGRAHGELRERERTDGTGEQPLADLKKGH